MTGHYDLDCSISLNFFQITSASYLKLHISLTIVYWLIYRTENKVFWLKKYSGDDVWKKTTISKFQMLNYNTKKNIINPRYMTRY